MQTVSDEMRVQGVGAPLPSIIIAKQFAPEGRPNFEMILSEGTQISVWNATQGKASTAKFILLFLISLNKYFNIVRPMSIDQMEELAIEFTEYTVFKFEDFIAFFEGVKRQRYGQVRDRLDPSIIWQFFRVYDEQRDEACIRMAREKAYAEPNIKSFEPTRDERILARTDGLGAPLNNIKKALKNARDKQ